MKDDQRIALTKRLLQEGLLRLLEQKDLSKINVTELCTESGINRATFYRHYEQPRDILNEMRLDIFRDVSRLTEKIELSDGVQKWLESTCCYFYEHVDLLRILFKYRTDEEFVVFLNDICREQFPEIRSKGYFNETDDETMRLGTYYFAGGIYYILRQWLLEPIHKTPQEVAALICRILKIT